MVGLLYVFGYLMLFGHADCRVMNGGRAKWIAEEKPLVADIPEPIYYELPRKLGRYQHKGF